MMMAWYMENKTPKNKLQSGGYRKSKMEVTANVQENKSKQILILLYSIHLQA